MIEINNVELNKNTVNVKETITIKVTATEVMANWQDVKIKTWKDLLVKTWDQVKRKIF